MSPVEEMQNVETPLGENSPIFLAVACYHRCEKIEV